MVGCQPHSSSLDEDIVQEVWRFLQEETPSMLSSPSLSSSQPSSYLSSSPSPRGAGCGWGPAAAVTPQAETCHPRLKPHSDPQCREGYRNDPVPSKGMGGGRGAKGCSLVSSLHLPCRASEMVETPPHLSSPSLVGIPPLSHPLPSDRWRGWRNGRGSLLPPLKLAK